MANEFDVPLDENQEDYEFFKDLAINPKEGYSSHWSGKIGSPLNIPQMEAAQDYLKDVFYPQAQAYSEYYDNMSSYVNNENSRRKSFFDLLTGSKDNSNPNTQVNPSFYKEAGWGIAPGGSMALLPSPLPPPEYLPKIAPYHAIPNPVYANAAVGGSLSRKGAAGTPKDKYYNPPLTFDNGTTEKTYDSAGQTYQEYSNTDQATMSQNIKQSVDKYAKGGYINHFTKGMSLSGPYSGSITLVNDPNKTYNAPKFSSATSLYNGAKDTIHYVLTALHNYSAWKKTNPNGTIQDYIKNVDKSGINNLDYYVSMFTGKGYSGEVNLADWIGIDNKTNHIYFTDQNSQAKGLSKIDAHGELLNPDFRFRPGVISEYVKLKLDNIVSNFMDANRQKLYGTYYDHPPKDPNLKMAKERAWQNDVNMVVEQLVNEMWKGKKPF